MSSHADREACRIIERRIMFELDRYSRSRVGSVRAVDLQIGLSPADFKVGPRKVVHRGYREPFDVVELRDLPDGKVALIL